MEGEETTGILSIEAEGYRVSDGEPVDKFRAILFSKEDNLRLVINLPIPQNEKKRNSSLFLLPLPLAKKKGINLFPFFAMQSIGIHFHR